MNDLITISVAVYNAEKYISTMIRSILNQTYTNLEVLLVNDGSTDDSQHICESFDDPRIRVINKENGGLSTARQTAIDQAKGKYICLVDADDHLSPEYVEKLYRAIETNKADIAVCWYCQYKESYERVIEANCDGEYEDISAEKLSSDFYDISIRYILSDSWNKMYSLEFLRNSKVRFSLQKQYNGTDLVFNHLLALHQPRYTVVKEPLYQYQILQTSRVRRKDKDLLSGFLFIAEKMLDEWKLLGLDPKIKNQIYKIILDYVRSALVDRYKNAENYRDFALKFRRFKKLLFPFLKEHFSGADRSILTVGIRFFLTLLKMPVAFPVYVYLKIRQTKVDKMLRSFGKI